MPNPPEASPEAKAKLGKVVGGAGAAALLISLVAAFEGKANDPYQDIVGVWTVCYGETNTQMRHYSDTECADMLTNSLGEYATAVLKVAPNLKSHPYQLAAATSLTFNIGKRAFAHSTVARRFSVGRFREACDAFLMWSKAGGRTVQGLLNRRKAERKVCLTDL